MNPADDPGARLKQARFEDVVNVAIDEVILGGAASRALCSKPGDGPDARCLGQQLSPEARFGSGWSTPVEGW